MNSCTDKTLVASGGQGQFSEDGFLIVSNVLSASECDVYADELTELLEKQQDSRRRNMGGLRNVLHLSSRALAFATSARVITLISDLIGEATFPVRAILFDKTDSANWGVPWHQDLAIAVAERVETPGFGPWSVKDSVVHVQPPMEILSAMVTLRLHLDDCNSHNGALRVLPRSHLEGELSSEEVGRRTASESVTCEVAKGGALLMRPLLLHASYPAKNPSHRRVLHIEYAATELPNGLEWSERNLKNPVRKEQL